MVVVGLSGARFDAPGRGRSGWSILEDAWCFASDETAHLLEGQVHVEYLRKRVTLNPGDTATFHFGTRGVWHVPQHAKKVFVLHQPGRLVQLWRKVFPAGA